MSLMLERSWRTSARLRITGSFFSGAGRTMLKVAHSFCSVCSKEELEATDGDGHGVAGVMFDILDEEKVLAQLFLGDQVG